MKIAVPSDSPGGLDSMRSEHFGHCELFTIVELSEDKSILSVDTIANKAHEAGGCVVPISLLRDVNVRAVIVSGIGAKPARSLSDSNITVYFADMSSAVRVKDVISQLQNNNLVIMHLNQACAGGGPGCHH